MNGIGDHIMMWPTLRALNFLYADQVVLASDETVTGELYHDLSFVRRIHVANTMAGDCRTFDGTKLGADLADCALLVSLSACASDALYRLLRKEGSWAWTVGFGPTFSTALEDQDENMFDSYFRVATAIEPLLRIIDFTGLPYFKALPKESSSKLQRLNSFPGFFALHPETKADKNWDPASLARSIAQLRHSYPEFAIVIIHSLLGFYGILADNRTVFSTFGCSLSEAAGLVLLSTTFIGCDSCMLHIADLSRIPTVALFRSTSVEYWGCRFAPNTVGWLHRDTGETDPERLLQLVATVLPSAVVP